MPWMKITLVVDAEYVDTLSKLLELMLAQAVTSENAGDDEFYEVAFPGTPDWNKVSVSGLFDGNIEPQPIIDFIHTTLNASDIPTTVEQLKDQDWERVWLDSFKPIKVGRNLWVCPSWCEPLAADERNIILDPGLAFGTGTHPTTGLCLEWLAEQDLIGKTVLDYGSGSGILAIAALFSGAEQADAVDIDPLAVTACQENAKRNKVENRMAAYLSADTLTDKRYDVVIANILADVVIELRGELLQHLKAGGKLLLTGILSSQADRVKATYGEQFQFTKLERDQWCLLVSHSEGVCD
jgi:ribosomal protein L11 methyltransferase